MANIPGNVNAIPGVYSDVVTQTRAVAVPGGTRLAAIIGEGSTDEVVVSQALGGGKDGLNATYTSTTGSDGRHFALSNINLVKNRTTLYKNGVKLVGIEQAIDSNPFSNLYDYRLDRATGRIELQRSHLLDQNGDNYVPLANVGQGTLDNLTLMDVNSPPETWTIRCVSVQRTTGNAPIGGTARFLAFGSVSGAKLDGYGSPIVWKADGVTVSNGILSFSIKETMVGPSYVSPFDVGDAFTVKVGSGVLVKGDTLTANYIPESYLNDPELLQGQGDVITKHGSPSLENTLSLGTQLLFANGAPAVITAQAAPGMPRRTSYQLSDEMDITSLSENDFTFELPLGIKPDTFSEIHFFVTDPTTKVETQVLPNKLDFYTIDPNVPGAVNSFVFDDIPAPGGYSYFYTVIKDFYKMASGTDGYIGRDMSDPAKGVFSSGTKFNIYQKDKKLKVTSSNYKNNIGEYTIKDVHDGKLYVKKNSFTDFVSPESGMNFSIVDPTTMSPIFGYSGSDGYISGSGTQVNFGSITISFSDPILTISNYKVFITGSTNLYNNGLHDIVGYDSITGELLIQKAVATDANMTYEVIDESQEAYYILLNHNVVTTTSASLRANLIDEKDASFYDAGWLNVLESLEKVECDIVVPLPKQTISAIFQNALAHCKVMSNIKNKKERMLFCGAISGLKPENISGPVPTPVAVEDIGILEGIQGDSDAEMALGNVEDLANYSVADAFGNTYRCAYFYPDQIVVNVAGSNQLIDGFYLAAAAAGYESADLRLENPLTNKTLTGFTILRNKQFSNTILEQLCSGGICTLQPVTGGGKVIWGLTTSQSGYPEEQEISIIFIRDRVAKTLRAGFSGFIGTPADENTDVVLNTRAILLLDSLVAQKLITGYRDLSVVRDSVDPRQYNISVRVAPTYSINWIYIKVGIGQI